MSGARDWSADEIAERRDLAFDDPWRRSLERSRQRREGSRGGRTGARLRRARSSGSGALERQGAVSSSAPGISRGSRAGRTARSLAGGNFEEWGAALASIRVTTHHAVLASAIAAFGMAWALTASVKPLWNDEIFTLHVAGQPFVGGLWEALMSGIEQTPPGFYVLSRVSMEILGTSPVAMRVPPMLAIAATMLCLYLFVARRLGRLVGVIAPLVLLTTQAYRYSYEARAYALVLAFVAAALLCWQSYTMDRRPRAALLGLALSGAAAVSCHYYALLALLPIALGEAVRTFRGGQVDWRVWVALAAAPLPLLAFLPLITSSMDFATVFWTVPYGTSFGDFYPWLLPGISFEFVLLVGVAAALKALGRSRRPPTASTASTQQFPVQELAAALGFVLLPVAGVIVGELVTGAFTGRYAVAAVIGVSILVCAAIVYLFGARPIATVAAAGVVIAVAFPLMAKDYHAATQWRTSQNELLRLVRTAHSGPDATVAELPLAQEGKSADSSAQGDPARAVVVAEPGAFTQLATVAPHRLRKPLVYLADPDLALEIRGTDSIERSLVGLAPLADLDVRSFDSYVAEHERFTVLTPGSPSWAGWLMAELASSGWAAEVRAKEGDHYLLDVYAPDVTIESDEVAPEDVTQGD